MPRVGTTSLLPFAASLAALHPGAVPARADDADAGAISTTLASLRLSAPPPPQPAAAAIIEALLAHHGPGTSGGGSSTISGETLRAGGFDISLRFDYTGFEHISRAEAEARAAVSGEFDAVDDSWVTTIGLAYGITDDFQLGAQIGYYGANNFVAAEDTGAGVESGTADPEGLTDLWINAKYRVLKGDPGNLALIAGIKLPVGDDNERLDNGELLEPSSQPGSGAVDFQAGAAYSRPLTEQLSLDSSALYTFRTKHDHFKVGDRLDLGAALAWHFGKDHHAFPQWSIFGELNAVIGFKDRESGSDNPNTGGTTLYLTPGVRARFTENIALTVAPSFPVYQDLNGDQDETRFKIAATLEFSF